MARLDDFLTTLISALVIGSLYALIALGYTMVYGILKFINFAHSDVFVLGAWSSLTSAVFIISRAGLDREHLPWWVGAIVIVLAMVVCGLVAFTVERLAYKPLRKAPRLNVLITAIGVSLLLQNVGQLQYQFAPDLKIPFGTRPQPMPPLLPDRALNGSTIATGTADAGAAGSVRLSAPVNLDPDRTYRLDLQLASGKSETMRVISPRPPEPPEAAPAPSADAPTTATAAPPTTVQTPAALITLTEIEVLASVDEAAIKGAKFTLVREPLVPIQLVDVAIVGSALLLMLALDFLVFRTKMGTAMRAVSFNIETASLMGINVDRVISFTFVLGAVLAGGAGFLNSLKYPLNISAHESWVLLGLKAFVAAVVGGIGNVRGAALGGFLIAFIEMFGKFYINPNLADVYVFSVLILVLLTKPSGLLGTPIREKV